MKAKRLFLTLMLASPLMLAGCGDNAEEQDVNVNENEKEDETRYQPTTGSFDFTITWKNWDGSTLEVDYGAQLGSTPTYDGATPVHQGNAEYGYKFIGWSPEVTAVKSSAIYTARFQSYVNSYTVSFVNYDGTVLENKAYLYDETPVYSGETPTKADDVDGTKYAFEKWDKEISPVKENITYTAVFKTVPKEFNIKLNNNGSVSTKKVTGFNSSIFNYGLFRNMKVFKGWSYNGTKVVDQFGTIVKSVELVEGMTFDAIWSDTVNIYYKVNDSEGGNVWGTATTKVGGSYTVKYTRNDGFDLNKLTYSYNNDFSNGNTISHSFLGMGDYGYDTLYAGVKDIFVYGEYTCMSRNAFANSLDPDVGNVQVIGRTTSEAGDRVYAPFDVYTDVTYKAIDKVDGYTFLGWYEIQGSNEYVKVSNEKTYVYSTGRVNASLYAKWDYSKISYNLNGGTNASSNPTSFKSTDVLSLSSATKEHYNFSHWSINDVTVTEVDGSKYADDITVVAHYTPKDYNIVYHLNGGTNNSSNPEISNIENSALDLLTPSKDGCLFDGWYSDEGLTNKITQIPEKISGDYDVYAKWIDLTAFNFEVSGNDIILKGVKDKSVSSVEIPNVFTKIGDNAFEGMANLTSIEIPYGVKEIGWLAFAFCDKLESVELPASITYIGFEAFFKCYALTTINIPHTVTEIDGCAFGQCTSLVSISLGSNVKKIGSYCFEGCTKLAYISLSYHLQTIGNDAFYGCTALTSITIPENVKVIEGCAFLGCTGLTEVVIPSSVTYVEEQLFRECGTIHITCMFAEQPEDWNADWNKGVSGDNITVTWQYFGS